MPQNYRLSKLSVLLNVCAIQYHLVLIINENYVRMLKLLVVLKIKEKKDKI